jgi:hypothetical protein
MSKLIFIWNLGSYCFFYTNSFKFTNGQMDICSFKEKFSWVRPGFHDHTIKFILFMIVRSELYLGVFDDRPVIMYLMNNQWGRSVRPQIQATPLVFKLFNSSIVMVDDGEWSGFGQWEETHFYMVVSRRTVVIWWRKSNVGCALV